MWFQRVLLLEKNIFKCGTCITNYQIRSNTSCILNPFFNSAFKTYQYGQKNCINFGKNIQICDYKTGTFMNRSYFHVLTERLCFLTNTSENYLVLRLHTSALNFKKRIDFSQVPLLDEKDLEEKFVRGTGPGGQSVNKTNSACFLKHIPTGIVVKSHEERNLHTNRAKARQLLISKLDDLYNGDMSVSAQRKRLQDAKIVKSKQKSRKREIMKKLWKEREGIE